jgi:hypothetical protein
MLKLLLITQQILIPKIFSSSPSHCTDCTDITTDWFTILPRVMTSKNAMSLMSLLWASDISDIRKTSTLHVGILIFSGLQHLCDECNRISKVNFFLIIAHYIRKIFTFEEIIFLLERCIVKKKTYLCSVWLEKWPDDKKAFFALSWYWNRQFLTDGIETIATLILYLCI